jgi:thioredoxin-like negative regulator of GroEL
MARLQRKLEPPRVDLVYFRPLSGSCTALDEKLFDLAAEHRGRIRLAVKHCDGPEQLFGCWISGTVPTVLFVRGGRVVAQMLGDLPRAEIEALLRASLASFDAR